MQNSLNGSGHEGITEMNWLHLWQIFSMPVVRYLVGCSVQETAVFSQGGNVCDTVKVCSVYLLHNNLIFLSRWGLPQLYQLKEPVKL